MLFFYVWGFSVVLVLVGRELNRALRTWLRRHGMERANLIIVGMGKIARDIARKVQNSPELGYHIVGVVNVRPQQKSSMFGVPVIGDYHDLPYLIDAYQRRAGDHRAAGCAAQRTGRTDLALPARAGGHQDLPGYVLVHGARPERG